MLERLLIVVALAIVGYLAYTAFARSHVRQAGATAQTDALLRHLRGGVPTVVLFTTPTCAPCKTLQIPALNAVQAELGDAVQVIEVDATEDAAAAQRWGVFSVPTTFILDGRGQPRDVNHGVADAAKLKRQIQAVRAY